MCGDCCLREGSGVNTSHRKPFGGSKLDRLIVQWWLHELARRANLDPLAGSSGPDTTPGGPRAGITNV